MTRLVLLAVLLSAPAAGQGYEEAVAELEQRRFGPAWRALAVETDPLRAARGRAAVLYGAGDPGGALRAAEAGLAAAPEDLELLHHAASSAIWLEDPQRAGVWTERLAAAVALGQLAPEYRPAWEEQVASFRARCDELLATERERASAVRRARGVSVVLLATVVFGLILGLRAGRAGPSGTTSRSR